MAKQERKGRGPQLKMARIVVDEINSVDRIQAVLEAGMRLTAEMSAQEVGAFGFGCGGNCDAWGFGCGNNCLQGLDPTEEVIKSRFAIDVLGRKEVTDEEMAAVRADLGEFHDATMAIITEKLDFGNMKERMKKYGKVE